MHIAQGIFKAVNVNKCTSGGNATFIFWVADWFGLMNDKMGGDLEKIKTVGKYFIMVWKAAGMDIKNCDFRWTSEEITKNAAEYWPQALDIVRVFNITRVKKCCQIMGRTENKLSCAQILYPLMQCTDIFFLKADVCQLGVDQRKVNMLAREYCDAVGRHVKPVILSHHMLLGLKQGQGKMSKSDPDSAIFMEDSVEDVRRKIMNAYCPKVSVDGGIQEDELHLEKDELANPCLDYVRYIILSPTGASFRAGSKTYTAVDDVRADFLSDKLSETDLKEGIISELNRLLDPVRRHFTENEEARSLLATIEQYKNEATTAKPVLQRAVACAGPARVVFAPKAGPNVTIDTALKVLDALEPDGILWIEDWSDFADNKLNGNRNGIDAYYKVLLSALKALAPELMHSVKVIYQSEVILKEASPYWISAINAGRAMDLGDVQEAIQREVELASQVVTFVMHVADMLSLSAQGLEVVCFEEGKHRHLRAQKYLESVDVKCSVNVKSWTPLFLHQDDAASQLLVAEAEPAVNAKVKKSFMEPQNVEFCPILNLLKAFHNSAGIPFLFALKRKPDNGGDITYDSLDTLKAHFVDGSLHPGDLKPSAQKHLNALLTPLRAAIDKTALKTLEQAGTTKKK
eukprot:GEMP01006788.1.p1 GENE.GEMP01006788.1~~GEMP01006788.1.p1  ORF type:complete len:630 (+),score=164.02 GEMP01006788.1:313-2202(+)